MSLLNFRVSFRTGLFLLLVPVFLSAATFSLFPKVGGGIDWQKYDPNIKYSTLVYSSGASALKYGYTAGLGFDTSFFDLGFAMLGLESGAYYTLTGSKIEYTYDAFWGDGSRTIEDNLGYLTIPILVKFSKDMYYVGAGAQCGYLLAQTRTTTDTLADTKKTVNISQYNSYDIAGQVIAGLVFKNIFLEAQYAQSLLDIDSKSGQKIIGHNLTVAAGYRFDLKK
jgi:hypothetical protein